jgi:hypothetical protein
VAVWTGGGGCDAVTAAAGPPEHPLVATARSSSDIARRTIPAPFCAGVHRYP